MASKTSGNVCETCVNYPVNSVRNPAKMERCDRYGIAVRGKGKACPQWEGRE